MRKRDLAHCKVLTLYESEIANQVKGHLRSGRFDVEDLEEYTSEVSDTLHSGIGDIEVIMNSLRSLPTEPREQLLRDARDRAISREVDEFKSKPRKLLVINSNRLAYDALHLPENSQVGEGDICYHPLAVGWSDEEEEDDAESPDKSPGDPQPPREEARASTPSSSEADSAAPEPTPEHYNTQHFYDALYLSLDDSVDHWIMTGILNSQDGKDLLDAAHKHGTITPKLKMLISSLIDGLSREAKLYFRMHEDDLEIAAIEYVYDRYGDLDSLQREVARKVGPLCFPGDSTVVVKDKGKVAMCRIEVGDKVLSHNPHSNEITYEEVFFFSHMNPKMKASFLEISCFSGHSLALSGQHLIPSGDSTSAVKPADTLLAGDNIWTLQPFGGAGKKTTWNVQRTHVKTIKPVIRTGLYCPHTRSGYLLVDGVLVSCYTTVIQPWLAHWLLLPIRFLRLILPAKWYLRLTGCSDTSAGVPGFLKTARHWYLRYVL